MRLKYEEQEKVLAGWVNTPQGKTAMAILRERYYDVPVFDKEPLVMAKREGKRELMEDLLEMVEE